ncbi:MAG TPA: sortase, partial [Marmoricola sp.]|nr:sortase [Marmoricola sp.]
NVRFNAHTYPDGSALGNRLLARLKVGNRIILYGNGVALCYRVNRKVVTTPRRLGGYYSTTGKPKLAIVVCSGRRLGPGVWTNRTIWYAKPVTS